MFKMWLLPLLALCIPLLIKASVTSEMHHALLVEPTASTTAAPNRGAQPLLVMLIDSLRWDLTDQFATRTNRVLPGFEKLKQLGGHVKRIVPVFPADCFPNLISLLTGLYPVDHGAIFSQMYDERMNRSFQFDLHETRGQAALAALQDKLTENTKVHMYHLPICSNPNAGSVSCEAYSADKMTPHFLNWTLHDALARLDNGSSDIVVVYYDRLDQTGHRHGPLSDELLLSELPRLDTVIEYLVDNVLPKARRAVNLVVTSDHGMTEVRGRELLDRFISPKHVKMVINRGSTVAIWPVPEHHAALRHRLNSGRIKSFSFHTNTTIPMAWRTGGDVFPPILLVAKSGYVIDSIQWPVDFGHYMAIPGSLGAHGYDVTDPDMHVPLFVLGPDIRPGSLYHGGLGDQVDTHALIATLVGGSWLHPNATNALVSLSYSASPHLGYWAMISNSTVLWSVLAIVLGILCLFLVISVVLAMYYWTNNFCHRIFLKPQSEMNEKLLHSEISIA